MIASSPAHNTDLIARIQYLYDNGLFVQAYAAAAPLGPLQTWRGTSNRVLAGRLASQLSANRLADAIFLCTWRADPSAPDAVLYGAMATLSRRGPLAALDLITTRGILNVDSGVRWDATAFAGYLYGSYRDFGTADRLIALALEQSGSPWIWTQRAAIYEMEDRYEEALDAARHAFDLDPRLGSTVYSIARCLSLFERDDEAIVTLRRGLMNIESSHLAWQLADLEMESGRFEQALATLAMFDRLAIIRDKDTNAWLAGRRCDIYSRLGDDRSALEQARLANTPFYKEVAARLEQTGPNATRVMLSVGFVRQHHMTCAPATLSALSRFWGRPADHLELAEAICYDGTPHHSERRWAVDHGWYAREFTVTWDSARALLDASIPFTLTTSYPGGSHLQAVIGYDAARGVLFIRDPYERVYGEFAEARFFSSYLSTGPRGMAIVPSEERARLDAIVLADAELHDLAYEVQDALCAYDRGRAVDSYTELDQRASGHRITLSGQRSLACYDGDRSTHLDAVEQLIARFPTDVNFRLEKADLLRQLMDRQTYLTYIEAQSRGPSSHTLFKLRYAQAMLEDGRQRVNATRLLTKLSRVWKSGEALSSLADAHWHAGGHRRAVDLYRLAATLEDTHENHALAYFHASRLVREEERALAFLRNRVERLGKRSFQPTTTLFKCLTELDRTDEAMVVLHKALEERPQDGGLLLFAAHSSSDVGDHKRADEFLQSARDR